MPRIYIYVRRYYGQYRAHRVSPALSRDALSRWWLDNIRRRREKPPVLFGATPFISWHIYFTPRVSSRSIDAICGVASMQKLAAKLSCRKRLRAQKRQNYIKSHHFSNARTYILNDENYSSSVREVEWMFNWDRRVNAHVMIKISNHYEIIRTRIYFINIIVG